MIPLEDSQMCIKFIEQWGTGNGKSWLVESSGAYDNERPPHVELRNDDEVKRGLKTASYHKMRPGMIFKLVELHRTEDTVAWYVAGLYKGPTCERAHFTVHHGNKAISDFLPVNKSVKDSLPVKEHGAPFKYNCNQPGKIRIGTGYRNLQDVYTYLEKSIDPARHRVPYSIARQYQT